jgi:hypothetical protein
MDWNVPPLDTATDSSWSSALESGDEPPQKASKTNNEPAGETRKKKRKGRKKDTQQNPPEQQQQQRPPETQTKRPSVKVAAGKSRHPFMQPLSSA